jgi:hypothetical protein
MKIGDCSLIVSAEDMTERGEVGPRWSEGGEF